MIFVKYEMEELIPIVGRLAEKYTAYESTSLSYEKAEQLMEAVQYCIHEMQIYEDNSIVSSEELQAQQAYEIGAAYVVEKTRKALELYHEILPEFACYGNRCLKDTFVEGIPAFFKMYDSVFSPQDTILTLDYPVLRDISGYAGIDRIYEFLRCICLEQRFLKQFPEEYVVSVLKRYSNDYEEILENLCEIVLTSIVGHLLAKKPLADLNWKEEDYLRIQKNLIGPDAEEMDGLLRESMVHIVCRFYGDCEELLEYLAGPLRGIVARLKNAAEYHALSNIF